MLFDDPECLHHVGTPHASDFSNGLNYPRCRQRDYNFGASFPYVYVRRFMFARRKIDDDAKSANTKDGGHPISLTYRMGYSNGPSIVRTRYGLASGRFTQEDPIGLAGGLTLYGYADGDPVNFTDPFGLCPDGTRLCDFITGVAAGVRPWQRPLEVAGTIVTAPLAGGMGMMESAAITTLTAAKSGTTVFRVFGGEARQMGRSWTTVNPSTVANYAAEAGLPIENTATHLVEGVLRNPFGVTVTRAAPGAKGPGGIIELVIPNAASKVRVTQVGPFIPK